MEGLKVVTAEEMERIEKLAYAKGASEKKFMEEAGLVIADIAHDYIEAHHLRNTVTLLVGKGNNGGDAYAAGRHLLQKGYIVNALHLYPLDSCTPLCREQGETFRKSGGYIQPVYQNEDFEFDRGGVIIDGIVGTGFQGKAEGIMARAIEMANDSAEPIISIDIPSGLSGTTGEVGSVAIKAEITVYLGLPKIGFFVGSGWDYVGELMLGDFGFPQESIDAAKPEAYLLDEQVMESLLPPIKRSRHKYQSGYVIAVAGSKGMGGAAILSSFATLRSGAGIVRLFHPPGISIGNSPPEIIRQEWTLRDREKIFEECLRASALFVGPGVGKGIDSKKLLKALLAEVVLPTVIDADGLFFLAEFPSWKLPKTTVLTPHIREMERLLKKTKGDGSSREFLVMCQNYCEKKKVTIVLKGAPTIIFHPQKIPLIVPRGDPGMATAGAGDVLTGIITAMLAQKLAPREAATLGVFLHALSGETAAFEKTSYGVVASDLIHHLPDAFSQIIYSLDLESQKI